MHDASASRNVNPVILDAKVAWTWPRVGQDAGSRNPYPPYLGIYDRLSRQLDYKIESQYQG